MFIFELDILFQMTRPDLNTRGWNTEEYNFSIY